MSRAPASRPPRSRYRREQARSARESWLSRVSTRKSLILDGTAAAHRTGIAMCGVVFATCPDHPQATAPSSPSLFKSLKEKKKENREAAATGCNRAPRVGRALPSVAGDAAVSRHGFFGAATRD
ncbi:hypothetical protein D1006_08625 [Burkholderia stabilis]|uniref:Uncharacterized protein n=1 Tax=Burkholderia stabilis TaxID=95485 RepID=A0A4Q2AQJ4_9BURK|nr:hypothetical protein [Burkholderia stabilis]RXV72399.1 hypothetical protein D1006_08625 [Burkholderia stabilis]